MPSAAGVVAGTSGSDDPAVVRSRPLMRLAAIRLARPSIVASSSEGDFPVMPRDCARTPFKSASIALATALALCLFVCPSGPSAAQNRDEDADSATGSIQLELNNAQDVDGACRISYLASNKTKQAFDRIAYDFVVFDAKEMVSRLLVLDFGQLPIGKTKVVQFDLSDQGCSSISRLLINDVSECSIAGGSSQLCIEGLKTSTRTSIVFGL